MILQMQPEMWQCAITSYAMALNVPIKWLIDRVGHDGSEILFPALKEPLNRRGHNIFELVKVGLRFGFTSTPIPLRPAILSPDGIEEVSVGTESDNSEFVSTQVMSSSGVIECYGPAAYHMVAYEDGQIFDPRGCVFPFSITACEANDLYIYCVWRVESL